MPSRRTPRTEPGDGRSTFRGAGEEGSAALEFLAGGLVLLVPIVYLVLALAGIQSAQLGTVGAAREAARAYAKAPDDGTGRERARAAVAVALADYGLAGDHPRLWIDCGSGSGPCPRRGALVRVDLRLRAPLPLVPDILGLGRRASVPVHAHAEERVSRFWRGR